MSQVNQRKSNMVGTQEISVFSLEANQKAFELVAPSKRTLGYKAPFVSLLVKAAWPSAFGGFTPARVFLDVGLKVVVKAGFEVVVKAGFARGFGIKGRVGQRPGRHGTKRRRCSSPNA